MGIMTGRALELLRRNLSPQAFRYVCFFWWNCRFYLPRIVASVFVRRTPKVQGFPGGHTSERFLDQLRGINVFAPTKMCRVMTWHGSDKGQVGTITRLFILCSSANSAISHS